MEILDYNYNTKTWELNENFSQKLKEYYSENVENFNEKAGIERVIVWSY